FLADRSEAEAARPPTAGEVSNLVPLPEVLSELAASGPSSKTVEHRYQRMISALGPELSILQSVPIEDIARADDSLLAEAITRLRAGKVIREAGYDGEYGVIHLFEENELKRLTAGGLLFDAPLAKRNGNSKPAADPSQPLAERGRLTAPRSGGGPADSEREGPPPGPPRSSRGSPSPPLQRAVKRSPGARPI